MNNIEDYDLRRSSFEGFVEYSNGGGMGIMSLNRSEYHWGENERSKVIGVAVHFY